MDDERSHSSSTRHHRHSHRTHKSDERVGDEQPDRRRHSHRRRSRDSSRSLSPGEIPPPGWRPSTKRRRHSSQDRRERIRSEEASTTTVTPPSLPGTSSQKTERKTSFPKSESSSDSDDAFGPMPAEFMAQQAEQGSAKAGKHSVEDIERFERMGFVMSGRRRKKKQIQRPAIVLSQEEKALRETELVARFKEMIEGQKDKGN